MSQGNTAAGGIGMLIYKLPVPQIILRLLPMNAWNEAASVFSTLGLQSRQAEGASVSRRTDRRLSR